MRQIMRTLCPLVTFVFFVVAGLILLSAVVRAQPSAPTIVSAVVTNPTQILVVFSAPLTSAQTAPHMIEAQVRLLPDNLTPTQIVQNAIARDTFAVTFPAIPATAARICFDKVEFPTPNGNAQSPGQVCADLSRNPKALAAQWVAALQAVPKASDDKAILASGFVTTASDSSAGGADISLNPQFNIPNLSSFLKIKKTSVQPGAQGDPRAFEAGAKYRVVAAWKPSELDRIAAATDGAELNRLIRDRQSHIIAGWLIDAAGKLEGDPTDFEVTNFVAEAALRIQTMTKGFGGKKGFWRGFVMPAGIEGGQSIGTTAEAAPAGASAAPEVNRILRYKTAGGFTLYYNNPGTLQRVELDIEGVLRHLFETESHLNADTKKIETTGAGSRVYAQLDLKVFVGETSVGRYGFRASFKRGSLPPVYAQVRSFDFGFVIESADGDGPRLNLVPQPATR